MSFYFCADIYSHSTEEKHAHASVGMAPNQERLGTLLETTLEQIHARRSEASTGSHRSLTVAARL